MNIQNILNLYSYQTLADPGGRRQRAPPFNGIQFFRFHIRFCRKAPALEVGAPPTGNPGSATAKLISSSCKCDTDIHTPNLGEFYHMTEKLWGDGPRRVILLLIYNFLYYCVLLELLIRDRKWSSVADSSFCYVVLVKLCCYVFIGIKSLTSNLTQYV